MSAAGTLARIARDNPALKALTLVDARAMAPLDDEGSGPLAGFSIAVKANIDVKGWPTTAGVKARQAVPETAVVGKMITGTRAVTIA